MKYLNLFLMPNGFVAPSVAYRTEEEAKQHQDATSFVGVMRVSQAVVDAFNENTPRAEYEESRSDETNHRAPDKKKWRPCKWSGTPD